MRGSTLPSVPTKTYDSISVNLKEKQKNKNKNKISHSNVLPLPSFFLLFFFYFRFYLLFFYYYYFYIIIRIHGSYCLIQIHFCLEIIYFFSVQFILNELSSSHFLTFEIFVKISSLKSLTTYPQKIVKILCLSQNSTKLFSVTRFHEMDLAAQSVSSSEI